MQLSDTLQTFIHAHAGDDLSVLLLSAARYPEVDVPFAAEQIAARRQIREKLPAWYADGRLVFPSKTAAEQCSSEQTARYKCRLLEGERHLCDLSGGLGVDSYYFAQKVERVTYVECARRCFEAAMYNFSLLQAGNIAGLAARAEEAWEEVASVDAFYLDPSRRREGVRLFALQDCEPDLTKLLPLLLRQAPKVIAKLSPMLDIRHTLTLLPGATAVHVVSVRNECRELLFVWRRAAGVPEPEIHCVNYTADGTEQAFRFWPEEEQRCTAPVCGQAGRYLYEPHASILKAGAFKLTAVRTGAGKLHVHSHLYTSDRLIAGFPGRVFRVREVIPFCGKTCRTIARHLPQASVSVRNFPLTVRELRRRTRIAEGGNRYVFATTLAGNERVLICCEKAGSLPAG
ncbi:MAG: SAM-dependent methyltransferase [Tannerella sp.]|jgi:hypothetical protein|nr:SAM-dependent methyltransferase [Tannerella sp.]